MEGLRRYDVMEYVVKHMSTGPGAQCSSPGSIIRLMAIRNYFRAAEFGWESDDCSHFEDLNGHSSSAEWMFGEVCKKV